ncbi:MAG: DUF5681 domain-containing protein [Endomicrobium sp.]|nr:DUF5681 domain-containing protein [Endomicrobium sp.]
MVRIPPVEKRFKKGTSGNPHGRPITPEKMLFEVTMSFLVLILKAYKKDKTAQRKIITVKKYLEPRKYERTK